MEWNTSEAMAALTTKNQIKNLKEDCIVESTLAIWIEIGDTKREEQLVTTQRSNGEEIINWESGFGIENEKWIPIEKIKTKQIYHILLKERTSLKN